MRPARPLAQSALPSEEFSENWLGMAPNSINFANKHLNKITSATLPRFSLRVSILRDALCLSEGNVAATSRRLIRRQVPMTPEIDWYRADAQPSSQVVTARALRRMASRYSAVTMRSGGFEIARKKIPR